MLQQVEEVLNCFQLTPQERQQILVSVHSEVKRQESAFFRAVTVAALLPIIQRDAVEFFQKKGMAYPDAEDLGGTLSLKIFQTLFGTWPRGNIGAWVTVIRTNVGGDFYRKQESRNRRLKQSHGENYLDRSPDPATEHEMYLRQFLDAPHLVRQIVEGLMSGDSFSEIAIELGISEEEAREVVQGIEGPEGGSSRLPNKRRKSRRFSRSIRSNS